MSYILEALKKAEAERQAGQAPGLHTLQVSVPQQVPRPPWRRWPWLAGGFLALSASLGLAWFQTMPSRLADGRSVTDSVPELGAGDARAKPEIPPAAVAALSAQAPSRTLSAAPRPAPPPMLTAKAPSVAAPSVAAPSVAAPSVAAPSARPAPQQMQPMSPVSAFSAAPDLQPRTAAPSPASGKPPEREVQERIPALGELPHSVQAEVPAITVTGYIYSEHPADRVLLVDKKLRREGDELAPGLRLERLLPGAAVLSFKGYRYRLPL